LSLSSSPHRLKSPRARLPYSPGRTAKTRLGKGTPARTQPGRNGYRMDAREGVFGPAGISCKSMVWYQRFICFPKESNYLYKVRRELGSPPGKGINSYYISGR
jgi:hypothetical protein